MKIIFLLIIFNISNQLLSQDFLNLTNSKTVTTISYWDKGENRTYHFKTLQEKFKNNKDKPVNQVITEYDIEFTVVEATDSFYIMQIEYSNFSIQDKENKNIIDQEIESLQNGMKILYKTNQFGQFDTIINIPELTVELNNQIEIISEKLKPNLPDNVTTDEFEEIIKNISSQFLLPENVEVLFLDDILSFHGYFGFQFVLDKPDVFEMIYPGFNGVELNGTGTVTLTSINKDLNSFMFRANSSPSKDELNKYLKEIIKMFSLGKKGQESNAADCKVTSKSKGRYSFELDSGWVKLITETTTNSLTYKKETIKLVSKKTITLN